MNCESNLCTQGRQPCPTPWQCGAGIYTGNGGRTIDTATCELDDAGDYFSAIVVGVICGLGLAILVLPLVL